MKAVEALRDQNIEVIGVMAIFTYGFEKAVQAFAAADCPFTTLSNYETLLEEAAKQQYIKPEEIELLQQWRKAPDKWK